MQGFHLKKKTQPIAEVMGQDTEESGSDKGNYANNRTSSPEDQDTREHSDKTGNGPKPGKSLDLSLISKQSTKKSINSKMPKGDGRNGDGFNGNKNLYKSKTNG